MRRRYALLIGALIGLAAVTWSPSAYAAAQNGPRFRQQILPLDCVFEIVDDGLGTVHYLTPETCQPAIIPGNPATSGGDTEAAPAAIPVPATASQTSGRAYHPYVEPRLQQLFTSSATPNSSGSNSGGHVLHVNNETSASSVRGLLLNVRSGTTLVYRPLIGNDRQLHTLTVTALSPSGLTLLLQPENQLQKLSPHALTLIEAGQPVQPVLGMRLEGSPSAGQPSLRLWLLSSRLTAAAIQAERQTPAYASLALAATLVLLGGILAVRAWRGWRP